jgi:hypothetical protein
VTGINGRRPAAVEPGPTRAPYDPPADADPVPPGPTIPEYFVPYQRVAMRVIGQAFRDLESPAEAAAAREFLDGSPMLRHWSAVAALDARSIAACARALVERLASTPATPCRAPKANGSGLPRRPTPSPKHR